MVSYALWFLSIILANEFILKIYNKKNKTNTKLINSFKVLVVLILLSTILFYKDITHFYMIIIVLFITVILVFKAISQLIQIGNIMPAILKSFTKYIIAGVILILFATLFEFFETIEITNLILEIQILYIGHFLFYAGLCMLIISFEKLYNLPGIYKEL